MHQSRDDTIHGAPKQLVEFARILHVGFSRCKVVFTMTLFVIHMNSEFFFFLPFFGREIGNGSWDSWTMPLMEQVIFGLIYKKMCSFITYHFYTLTIGYHTSTCRVLLCVRRWWIRLVTQFFILSAWILKYSFSLNKEFILIYQVKQISELSEGYNIVGLSQVIDKFCKLFFCLFFSLSLSMHYDEYIYIYKYIYIYLHIY